jgi:preprotein translocase subunit SecY
MTSELTKRVAFTLGALLVYFAGLHVPLPGVDVAAWAAIFDMQSGGLAGAANALSGDALRGLSILSLAITPYVTAAIILRLLSLVSHRLRAVVEDGERGRVLLERYAVSGTAVLAALQSYGIAIGLEGIGPVVPQPGLVFRLTTVLTLTAGALFLAWLAGRITARGIGNGVALIIAAGIVNALPREVAALLEGSRQGIIGPVGLPVIGLVTAILTALVVVAERSRRRLPVEFTGRAAGTQRPTADIALKLNPAGLMPSFLASLVLTVVTIAVMFAGLLFDATEWPDRLRVALAPGTLLHLGVTAALIAFFTLLYTAFVCDPEEMAARLAACGGALPGIAPGEATAAHLDRVISRTAAIGAAYLVLVMVLPDFLASYFQLPIALGGTSILVLVCVVLDLAAEIRGCLTIAR